MPLLLELLLDGDVFVGDDDDVVVVVVVVDDVEVDVGVEIRGLDPNILSIENGLIVGFKAAAAAAAAFIFWNKFAKLANDGFMLSFPLLAANAAAVAAAAAE